MTEDPNLPDFEFEKLKELDKDKLDIIKLSLEIAAFKSGKKFEQKKFKWENIRAFGVVVIVALLTWGVNSYLKKSESDSNKMAHAWGEFERFTEQYRGSGLEDKNKLACNISGIVIPSGAEDLRDSIKRYTEQCESNKQLDLQKKAAGTSAFKQYDDATKNNIAEANKFAKVDSLENQIRTLETKQKNAKPEQLASITKKIKANKDSIKANSSPIINQVANSLDVVNKNIITQIKTIDALNNKSNNSETKNFPVQWFKTGYYVRFDDIKVKLLSESKSAGVITVMVCNTPGDWNCDNDKLPVITITYNTPYSFPNNGFIYTLSLKTIDYAGKNPFKLAAYVGMSKSVAP